MPKAPPRAPLERPYSGSRFIFPAFPQTGLVKPEKIT
jgi:hypothetical protein